MRALLQPVGLLPSLLLRGLLGAVGGLAGHLLAALHGLLAGLLRLLLDLVGDRAQLLVLHPAGWNKQARDEANGHRAERLGGYLQESDGDRILRDVEDFARRNPWAVAAGGLLVGFAASRMLKASSGDRYRSSLSTRSNGTTGVYPGEAVGHGTRASQFEPHV